MACLCGAAAACCEFTNVIEEDGALQGIKLRGVGCDLSQERVCDEHGGLIGVAGGGVAQEGRDIDFKSPGETIQRAERGHGLPVLDLRDVGAGNVHAGGELALAEIAYVAQIADSGCDLNALVGGFECGDESEWRRGGHRLFDLE